MLGHYIPKGLTKTSEGLSRGYVMFAPASSASTYLKNRTGEVVDEWKSNYMVGSVYLNDDGSVSLLAQDPEFPVFAGGGEAGRIQKTIIMRSCKLRIARFCVFTCPAMRSLQLRIYYWSKSLPG